MQYNGFSIDTEADGLIFEARNLWVVNLEDLDTEKKLQLHPYKDPNAKAKFMAWLDQYEKPNIAFHNGLGYDIFVLMFVLGIQYSVGPDSIEGRDVNFVDTFYLSMFLNPDRGEHGIAHFGEKFNMPKIDLREELINVGFLSPDAPDGAEFMQHHPLMDTYCERDAYIGKLTFIDLIREWKNLYKSWDNRDWPAYFKAGQKAFYLMSCQELTGWKFDVEAGQKLQVRIEGMMEELRADVEPQLPPRPLKKTEEAFYKIPAKPFKKDGSYSSHWDKFVEKHSGVEVGARLWEFYGKTYSVEGGKVLDVTLPMEMANQDQMKDWFLSMGWKPTLFNFKRDANGKPERDPKTRQLILTTPKLQEQGKLCPNLEAMEGDLVKKVVKWLSLRNRLSVLTGWLENPRLKYDGRIGAGRTGIAATHHQKHKVVVNVPKADPKVLLGYEFRELWKAEDGYLIAAGDAAALEGRVQGHYCVPMDTQALTKEGWKNYHELIIGEEIMAYNPETKLKEWTPLLEKCFFESADVFSITNHNFKVRATANHRWFVEYRNTATGMYEDRVVETKDLNTCCNLIVNAPTAPYSGNASGILDGKYGPNWVERIIDRGSSGVEAFTEGFLIADGHYSNQNATKGGDTQMQGKGRWRWGQNLGDHFEAALTASYIAHSGYLNVSYRNTPTNRMGIVTLNKKSTITMQRMKIVYDENTAVWCPRTALGSWVMRQGDVITITGNTFRYDNGTTAEELLKGDVHSKNCMAFYGSIYEEVASLYNSPEFDKENPKWKPYRSKSKNGFYAILYGAAGPKVASTLGIPESKGQAALEAFWEANPGTAELKKNLELYWEKTGQKKYLPGIDGRILLTRKKSALLNTIFQSCGGIAMDYACCFLDSWLGGLHWDELRRPYYKYKGYIVRRIGYFHDEVEFECSEDVAEEIARLIEKAISKAGQFLKIKVPLEGEGKVGKNWKEVH